MENFFTQSKHLLEDDRRILEEKTIEDPFTDNRKHPIYTNSYIGNMFYKESKYVDERHNGYVNFVKNKYEYFDVNFDPAYPKKKTLIKMGA